MPRADRPSVDAGEQVTSKPPRGSVREREIETLLTDVAELEAAERFDEAMSRAWEAFDLVPGNARAKRRISRLLREHPQLTPRERRPDIQRLLSDPEIGPERIAAAGWSLVPLHRPGTPEATAQSLEGDPLALALLAETYVYTLPVEIALTALRRWLLLSGKWQQHSQLSSALIAQAALNGGAWLFDDEEREVLENSPQHGFAAAYLPSPPAAPRQPRFEKTPVQAVANQYSRWPYPAWSRLTVPRPTTLPSVVEKLDGGIACKLPAEAEVLVAGCGTGREAASFAKRFPDARVTAIDVSASSMAFAAERCQGMEIDFRLLDLHQAGSLGRQFDLIVCSGVLHHVPDPEAAWAKLVEVLKPGGAMKVMVYSRLGRLRIEGAKARIADLRQQPVDDDLLRAARRRLLDEMPQLVQGLYDFYYLAGVHDLLFNCHEDCFDVPRIVRALDSLQLELLAFSLPSSSDENRYRAEHPNDPLFRDVSAWAALEKRNPFLFSGMYEFWCRRPG
jgi:SAM-dependent methyltransferase